jgi:ubiquinone/menaquinone biosynthesis C-methylase UbiE
MMDSQVARAYDAVATAYDDAVAADQWIRDRLWTHYGRVFRAGQQVLDFGCGTGIDTVFLAQRDLRVTAVDVSARMLAQLERKIESLGLTDRVDVHEQDMACLQTRPDASFDGIISSFASLNTLPDLTFFATNAARLLRPRGRVVLHLLNRFSIWEWIGLVHRREWLRARRLGRTTHRRFVLESLPVDHYLFSPGEAYRRFFAGHFILKQTYGVGVLRPPPSVRRIPLPVIRALSFLEPHLGGHWPFVNWGRFYVLDLEKKG